MNDKDINGILGETKVISFLIENGFDVFFPYGGKTTFDLVAHREGELFRIEVKTTEAEAATGWYVKIKKSRHNKNINIEKHFKPSQCDFLAVYIKPKDKVVLIDVEEICTKTYLTVPHKRV